MISEATTFTARTRGLLGRDGLAPSDGLLLHTRSVHTFGMRFAIDLHWLDGDGDLVRVDRDVPPWRVRTCWRARVVIETAA